MTTSRSEIVNSKEVSIYHCISRCVRRAFLCGFDTVSSKSFEHRRQWIRARLSFLVEIFTVEVIAYSVMNNHLHSLLRIRPDLATLMTDEEVARRWRILFPLRRVNGVAAEPSKAEITALISNPERIVELRKRLSSISWFNRCLNEHIARAANAEDDCTGRFWEGRFKSQRIYDVAALIACGVYVELNPVRAGIATTLEESDHTSIQDRIHTLMGEKPARCQHWASIPLVSIQEVTNNTLTLEEYITLVDLTGRTIREGKGSIPDELAPILERLKLKKESWVDTVRHFKWKFKRVVGPEGYFRKHATEVKKQWFQGISNARECFST